MKVGILTTFQDFHKSYSLAGVVLDQAGMLKQQGVDFTVFVNEPASLNKESIESVGWLQPHIRCEVPAGVLEEDIINEELRSRLATWLREIGPEYDVLITHDWAFASWFVTYNAAVRDVVDDLPGTTFVHWTHSAPGPRRSRLIGAASLRYELIPNSLYVYLNYGDRLRFAEYMGTDVSKIAVCYNPMDAADFLGCGEAATKFIHRHRLWDRDIMQVYPLSMPRATEKGLPRLLGVFSEWKRLGFKTKLVVVNAHCNAPKEKKYVESFKISAREDWGLTENDLIFTSDWPGWDQTVPHEVVSQLFRLSNVFVFPSWSENCSRVLQEASLAGCLVAGNESFAPMKEFLHPTVPQFPFGSLQNEVHYPGGERAWLREVGRVLLPQFEHPMFRQQAHMLRLAAWETVWRDQFQPILQRAVAMTAERRAA